MELELQQLITFMGTYGWQMALIALVGIILLGILKYVNAFSKVEKEKRKPIYFAISMGFSLIATTIYLLIIKQFNVSYLITVTGAIYAMNQAMYAVYETTNLRDLVSKIFNLLSEKIKNKQK